MIEDSASPRILVSCSADFISDASAELRRHFGEGLAVARIGVDMLAISKRGLTVADVATASRTVPLIFPRHLTVELLEAQPAHSEHFVEEVVALVRGKATGHELAVQAWSSGTPPTGFGPADASRLLTSALTEHGYKVVRGGASSVLSGYITPKRLISAFNRVEDSLSDWPGGRVRLARSREQVSRAEFKLEELFAIYPLDLARTGTCLDLGAAPGGWTRIIRKFGPDVYAVDPAALNPNVAADPGVHYFSTTAGDFLRSTSRTFDMVVNDMRMSPLLSSQVMVDAAERLRRGALAIVTLKLGTHNVLSLIDRSMRLLKRAYDPVFVRNLHHNRVEITVVLRKR